MESKTIFVRYTAPNGRQHDMQHQVWCRDRFLAARQEEAEHANADARRTAKPGDPPPLARVEVITREQYLAARRPAATASQFARA